MFDYLPAVDQKQDLDLQLVSLINQQEHSSRAMLSQLVSNLALFCSDNQTLTGDLKNDVRSISDNQKSSLIRWLNSMKAEDQEDRKLQEQRERIASLSPRQQKLLEEKLKERSRADNFQQSFKLKTL